MSKTEAELAMEAVDLMASQQAMTDEGSLARLSAIVHEAVALGQRLEQELHDWPPLRAVKRCQDRAEDLARKMWLQALRADNPLFPPDAADIHQVRQIVLEAAQAGVQRERGTMALYGLEGEPMEFRITGPYVTIGAAMTFHAESDERRMRYQVSITNRGAMPS